VQDNIKNHYFLNKLKKLLELGAALINASSDYSSGSISIF